MNGLKTMAEACTLLSEGEVLQLVNMYNLRLTEGEYLDVIYRKTAALIAASCRVGAFLGDASPPVIDAFLQFGTKAGYAFQLVDDALDYTGEEGRTGKSIGKDLREGNITLPLLRVSSQATPAEAERLSQIVVHSETVDSAALDDVLELIEKYKAIPYTLDRAQGYIEAAKAALSVVPDSVPLDALRALADYIIERDY